MQWLVSGNEWKSQDSRNVLIISVLPNHLFLFGPRRWCVVHGEFLDTPDLLLILSTGHLSWSTPAVHPAAFTGGWDPVENFWGAFFDQNKLKRLVRESHIPHKQRKVYTQCRQTKSWFQYFHYCCSILSSIEQLSPTVWKTNTSCSPEEML